jgi:hypothetical protein
MPFIRWPLRRHRPQIEVVLCLAGTNHELVRSLVADTGAGTLQDVFELILDEDDCLLCGGIPVHYVRLSGAFVGEFPVYFLDVRIPALAFDDTIPVVGVHNVPRGFYGIACFRSLSRFTYGNRGDQNSFALESKA